MMGAVYFGPRWAPYVADQISAWFEERGLSPIIVVDPSAVHVDEARVHGATAKNPYVPLCKLGKIEIDYYRPADSQDMRRHLPCRKCTSTMVGWIKRGDWIAGEFRC